MLEFHTSNWLEIINNTPDSILAKSESIELKEQEVQKEAKEAETSNEEIK